MKEAAAIKFDRIYMASDAFFENSNETVVYKGNNEEKVGPLPKCFWGWPCFRIPKFSVPLAVSPNPGYVIIVVVFETEKLAACSAWRLACHRCRIKAFRWVDVVCGQYMSTRCKEHIACCRDSTSMCVSTGHCWRSSSMNATWRWHIWVMQIASQCRYKCAVCVVLQLPLIWA